MIATPQLVMAQDDLYTMIYSNNPQLKKMEQDVASANSGICSSIELENPRLKFGINNLSVSNPSFYNDDMTTKEIGIAQEIPFLLKSLKKRSIAKKEKGIIEILYQDKRAELAHLLRQRLAELKYYNEKEIIITEYKGQLKLVVESEIIATKNGNGSLSYVLKANTDYSMVDEELINIAAEKTRIFAEIERLISSKIDYDIINREASFYLDDIKDNINNIIETNNQIKVARLLIEKSSDTLQLEKYSYYPDIEFGLSYMQRSPGPQGKRDDMMSAMISMPIPIFAPVNNMPKISAMKNDYAASRYGLQDMINSVTSRYTVLSANIVRDRKIIDLYRTSIIPQSEISWESALAGYRAGKIDIPDLIEIVKEKNFYKMELLDKELELSYSISELAYLAGKERI